MISEFPLTVVYRRRGYHWFVVATVCVGAFMAALDASIINIALPIMKRDLHTHMRIIEWVSLSYILTLAALLVPFSRLSDMFGRRWMYSLGFSVFIVGSFLCGLAPSLGVLFTSRVLQAVGAAMLQANSVSMITAVTPSCDRGKAIGIQASAQGVGLSLGPLVGGILITLLGWRWIFYVNVPIGVIGTLLGILILPKDKPSSKAKFDFLGALTLAPALVAVIYVLNAGIQLGWNSPLVVLCYIVIVVGFLTFHFIERKRAHPMVDFTLFKNRTFLFGNLTVLMSFAVMYAVMFLAPFYLDNAQKMSPFQSGLYLTAIPIGMTVLTPLSGAIADKIGPKIPLIIGMVFMTTGCGILSYASEWYRPGTVVLGLLFVGFGMGLFTPPNNSQIMGCVPPTRFGITGGMLNMSRTLGMGFGVTLGGLSYQYFLQTYGVFIERNATFVQMVPSFRDAYIVVACIGIGVILLSLAPNPGRG